MAWMLKGLLHVPSTFYVCVNRGVCFYCSKSLSNVSLHLLPQLPGRTSRCTFCGVAVVSNWAPNATDVRDPLNPTFPEWL